LVVQGCFALTLHKCIYHALIRLTPITFSLSPLFLIIQQLTVHCVILFSYVHGMFQYFSLSNILLPCPPP
jgi:hypothetical protein